MENVDTVELYGPIGLDLKPVRRALKVPPRPSISSYLGDVDSPLGVSTLGPL